MAGKTSEWRPGSTVCRCCLTEGCYKDISTEYFWMGKREVYAEMLSDTLNVSISYAQTGGRLICEPCIARLRDASDFKRQVQDCEKTFMNHLDPSTSKSSVHVEVESLEDVKMERVKVEKDASDDDDDYLPGPDFGDDDDDDDLDDEPLTKLASAKVKVPKKEAVEILDMLDTSQITVKRKASSKTKEPPKKVKKKEIVVKPTTSKAKQAAAEREKKKKGIVGHSTLQRAGGQYDSKVIFLKTPISLSTLVCEDEADAEEQDSKTSKENKKYNQKEKTEVTEIKRLKKPILLKELKSHSAESTKDREDKMQKRNDWVENILKMFEYSDVLPFVYKHCKYKCFVCSDTFLDVKNLKEHFETHTLPEIDKKLRNREIIEHQKVKVDITCLKCKLCSKRIPEFQDLKDHLEAHGKTVANPREHMVPFKLEDNTISCQICGEVYLHMKHLITHMNQHYNNFSCEICGAAFMSIKSLRSHQQSHENGHFPCDKCEKVFPTKVKRDLHYKSVHLKKTFSRCPICNERFSSTYRRAKHMRVMHNKIGLHRCDFCGRRYDMKTTLTAHIKYTHLQERKVECEICHSKFFTKYCLARHMVIHTGEKKFKCDFCSTAFARKNRLTEHLKSHVDATCVLCGQRFLNAEKLAAHFAAVHSGA